MVKRSRSNTIVIYVCALYRDENGYEMPAQEWHNKLGNPKALVLDCRNSYESDVSIIDLSKYKKHQTCSHCKHFLTHI
jgi:predicted sulfurtransferase